MILGKLPVAGRPTIWMIEGQGPISRVTFKAKMKVVCS